jgi:PTH1 family peptidyl-tRNA hydrolase
MFLIVGLGNPGKRYSLSRHNVGFMVIDEVAKRHKISVKKKGFNSLYCESIIDLKKIVLLKPQTFMNLSGKAVFEAVNFYKIPTSDVLVVHDEIDLPTGTMQIKFAGGSAGHKGIDSIIRHLGRSDFIRIRIGVGRPSHKPEVVDHVLSGFEGGEIKTIKVMIERAADAVAETILNGLEKAMNKFNQKKGIRAEKRGVNTNNLMKGG